jgi:hypothetical protein
MLRKHSPWTVSCLVVNKYPGSNGLDKVTVISSNFMALPSLLADRLIFWRYDQKIAKVMEPGLVRLEPQLTFPC